MARRIAIGDYGASGFLFNFSRPGVDAATAKPEQLLFSGNLLTWKAFKEGVLGPFFGQGTNGAFDGGSQSFGKTFSRPPPALVLFRQEELNFETDQWELQRIQASGQQFVARNNGTGVISWDTQKHSFTVRVFTDRIEFSYGFFTGGFTATRAFCKYVIFDFADQ